MERIQHDAGRIRTLAERQWRDFQRLDPGTIFAEPAGADITLAEAYGVQKAVGDFRCSTGDRLAGYKIGCIGPKS
jgi:2-keto-4-pentenoate hydratase